MKIVIDRLEGKFAVCELPNKTMVNVPIEIIDHAAEGDIIEITINKADTEYRKNKIKKLMNDVWGD